MKHPVNWISMFILAVVHFANAIIVVPNDRQNAEGNSGGHVPFHIGTNSARYQQVFDSSQFSSLRPEGEWITGLLFRVDSTPGGGGGPFTSTLTNIQLSLSTTTLGPDSLSPVFAQNVGSNEKIIFGPRSVSLSSGFSPMSSPQTFQIGIFFEDNPFFYNPQLGNLLLDVRNFAGGTTTFFDGVLSANDVVSSVWALSSAASSGVLDTKGLIVEFVNQPVPEPATLTLVALGIMGFAFFRRYRVSRK